MNKFKIEPADLAAMEQIARVSSRADAAIAQRWTELAIYYRPGEPRPFVAVSEGHSSFADEKLRFQYAVVGTLDRAVRWFEGSALRDELAAAIPGDHDVRWPMGGNAPRMLRVFGGEALAEIANSIPGRVEAAMKEAFSGEPRFYTGPDRLTDALRWLYPAAENDSALAQAFDRDFGMPGRTTRNTLAIEAGRASGKVGSWVRPFVTSMRWFDRKAWEADRG